MNENTFLYPRIRSSMYRFQPNWPILIYMIPIHLAGLLGWPLFLCFGGTVKLSEFLIFLLMVFLAFCGINFGYHRGLSHQSFKMGLGMRLLVLFSGASTGESSALIWCADHRRHHRFQDTERDPYNINRSFWWAHMGWMLGTSTTKDFSNCKDLLKDPWIVHQHKYYILYFVFTSFAFPTLLGFLIGRPLEAFLLAGLTRLFLVNHTTFLINSYAHYFGKRPYSLNITAKDSWFLALFTAGEGYHNYHHKFPYDYRNGPYVYQWDPTKWLIYYLSKIGLVKKLIKTPEPQIYRARYEVLLQNIQHMKNKNELLYSIHFTETLERTLNEWQSLSEKWWFRQKKVSKEQLKELKKNIKFTKKTFLHDFNIWKNSLKKVNTYV